MVKLLQTALVAVMLSTGAMATMVVEKGGTFNIRARLGFDDGNSITNYGTLTVGVDGQDSELTVGSNASAKIVNKTMELNTVNLTTSNFVASGATYKELGTVSKSSGITITNEADLTLTSAQNTSEYTVDMTADSEEAAVTATLDVANLGTTPGAAEVKTLNVKFVDGTDGSTNSHSLQITGNSDIAMQDPYYKTGEGNATVLTLNSDMSGFKNGKLIVNTNASGDKASPLMIVRVGDTKEINCDVDVYPNSIFHLPSDKELTVGEDKAFTCHGKGSIRNGKGTFDICGKLRIKGTVTLGAE